MMMERDTDRLIIQIEDADDHPATHDVYDQDRVEDPRFSGCACLDVR